MTTGKEGVLNAGIAYPDEILVVDDTSESLKLLEEILAAEGYRVRLANDGALALRSARIQPPALVLLDIRMPGMDGYEVCRRLKEDDNTRSIPVIFLSILEDDGEKVKAFQAGGVDYINKPFRPAEVLARVKTHLALWHAKLDLESRNAELEEAREMLEQRVKERTAALEASRAARKEAEEANVRLQQLDRMKNIFIASMSHELRTPLNAAIGFTRILHQEWAGPLNEEQKENLSSVLRSCNYLLSLVNNVIDVSRIEAGMIEKVPDDFDVFDVVSEVVKSIENNASDNGIELKVQAVHQKMYTDRTRLLQCLQNLVTNAVKFTEKGTIIINAEVPKSGDMLELSVADTGIGIREEDLDKLFSPFVRLDSPLRATVPGTGLGLYLTHKLVTEVLEGEISVQSAAGEGSLFALRVPLYVSEES